MTLNELVEVVPVKIENNKSKIVNKHNNYITEIVDFLKDPVYIKKAVGKNGEEIGIYKFRTMIKDADKYVSEILRPENIDHQGKIINDPRITRLGKFLRKYHLDELPQIYNVLKGDMRFVGIRPMEKEFWEQYPESIRQESLKHKPGFWGVNYSLSEKRSLKSKDTKSAHHGILRLYQLEYNKNPVQANTKFFLMGVYNKIIGKEHSS